jgi:hypothetical protein
MYMGHFQYGWRVPEIHNLNPSVVCLLYRNIRAVYQSSAEYQVFLNSDWILRDANGILVYDTGYPTDWIVDPGNPDYQTWLANWLQSYVNQYGYDGVFLDNCLPSSEYMYDASSNSPINPRTGQVFTQQQFEQAIIQLVNKVKATIGNKLVIGNGIFDGERFFDTSRNQYYVDLLTQSQIDGIESEDWLMDMAAAQWYSEAQWLESINFLTWLENDFLNQSGKVFLPVCQNAMSYDTSKPYLPTGCTQDQYALFCFASLMLGMKTSTSYVNFGYFDDNYTESFFNISLGSSTGAYYVVNGTHVYTRDFSNAKVLVNPTASPYILTLASSYQTPDGQQVSSPLTIKPYTGAT